jgi:hypothetical protein
MINTHYSQYRIFPRRLAGRAGRPREKTVNRQSSTAQKDRNQTDSKDNPRKGNTFDDFA